MSFFQRISRAISRLGRSTAPVQPVAGPMATQVGLEEIQAVEQEEFPPEEQQDDESE